MMYELLNTHATDPHHIAICTSEEESLTIPAVKHRVHQWANYLLSLGVKSGDRVALLLDNEDHHVFIFLALERINACCVLLDADIPKRQLGIDIQTLSLKTIIIESTLQSRFDIHPAHAIVLSNDVFAHIKTLEAREPACVYQTNWPEKELYLVSSSGSTGNKKWIPITGAGFSYWSDAIKIMELSASDSVLTTRSPAYDARIFEYLLAFSTGATLHLPDRKQRKNLPGILSTCQKASIRCILLIPSQFEVENLETLISQLKQYGIRHLMVTGDTCTIRLKTLCENNEIKLWNCYGPTEATFGLSILCVNGLPAGSHNPKLGNHPRESGEPSTCDIDVTTGMDSHLHGKDRQNHISPADTIVPIGKPHSSEVQYHLIDQKLFIESPYLTTGYINCDDDNKFIWITKNNGERCRIFDTGDTFTEAGEFLFYHGRHSFDGHCKIAGTKVTPHFIEQCIHDYNHEKQKDLVQPAVVIKPYLGKPRPFAYIAAHPDLNKTDFIDYLKERFRSEEFPILVSINTLPRLALSQKIDRQSLISQHDNPEDFFFHEGKPFRAESIVALEDVEGTRLKLHHLAAARKILALKPVNYHAIVTSIWQELFQQEHINDDVEFLLLGGHSLLAMQMVSKINERLDPTYSYTTLLSLPRITIGTVTTSLVEKNTALQNQAFIHLLIKASLPCGPSEVPRLVRGIQGSCSVTGSLDPADKPRDVGERVREKNLFFLPALLGEGYFSYRNLARDRAMMVKDENIYGLGDPGIADETLLPNNMAHAVQRYICAIKSIQKTGPYHLLGFSFGATLAYEVAQELYRQGDTVQDIHLLDGFPPCLYQQLTPKAHAQFLQDLLNFIVKIANNTYYGESVKCLKLTGFSKLNRQQQIELGFDHLKSKLTKPASILMLNMAKRHVSFMQSAEIPKQRLPLWPTFYLTDTNEFRRNVLDQLPGLSKSASDRHYFFWNQYWENMTRCGIELPCEHLETLSNNQNLVPRYWTRAHDALFNLKVDHYGPDTVYRLYPYAANYVQLGIFFLSLRSASSVVQQLANMGLSPRKVAHDKSFRKYTQQDTIYTAQMNLFCDIPSAQIDEVQAWLNQSGIPGSPSDKRFSINRGLFFTPATHRVDLQVKWNRSNLLFLSFRTNALPSTILSILQRLDSKWFIADEEAGQINATYTFILVGCSVYDAIRHASDFLADFITVLEPCVNENSVFASEAKTEYSFSTS